MRIDTISGRAQLRPRRAPYFEKLGKGRYLGVRKHLGGGATWVARYRTEGGDQEHTVLNELSDGFDYDKAVAAAWPWFRDMEAGITGRTEDGEEATVETACRRYLAHLGKAKGDRSSNDAKRRFERTVYGSKKRTRNTIADTKLSKLRSHHFSGWRNGLESLSRSSVNRTTTTLRAALMLAVNDGLARAELAYELRKVKQYKNAGKRRSLYLDLSQRRALINACNGAGRTLIEAAAVTGCRAGELTSALCKHFDPRQKTLIVSGKTGHRAMLLAPAAIELFTRLVDGRQADDFLLVRDDGKPWMHSDWDELVREAAKAAELPPGTVLYTLRHSWITEALMGGISTLEVSKITGTSLLMIEKHYGHLVSSTASERLAKLELR